MFANRTPPAVSGSIDTYWNNVILLMSANGADGSTTIIDSSILNNTMTATNGATISTAQSKFGGSSLFLDGTNDFVSIVDSNNWSFTGQFTIEAWVYFLDSGQTDFIIGQWPGGTATNCAFIFTKHSTNRLQFVYGVGSANPNITGTSQAVPINSWVHVAVTRDQNNLIRMFVNGVADTVTATVNGTINNSTAAVYIGSIVSTTLLLKGYIDEMRVTKDIARYTSNFTVPSEAFPTTGPAAATDTYWSNVGLLLHGDGSDNGTTFTDSSSNNVPWTRLSTGALTKTAIKKYGTASIFLPNDNASLIYTDSATYTSVKMSGKFTYEFWLYPTLASGIHGISSYGFFSFLIYVNGTTLTMEASSTDFGVSAVEKNLNIGTITQNAWQHWAICRDGASLQVYKNGTQTYTSSTFFADAIRTYRALDTGFTNRFALGSTNHINTTQHLGGYLDEVRITQNVVRYTGNFSVPTQAFPNS
jgi:hypothetical protein